MSENKRWPPSSSFIHTGPSAQIKPSAKTSIFAFSSMSSLISGDNLNISPIEGKFFVSIVLIAGVEADCENKEAVPIISHDKNI